MSYYLQCSVTGSGQFEADTAVDDGCVYSSTTAVVRSVMDMTKAVQLNVPPSEYLQYVKVGLKDDLSKYIIIYHSPS